ncbi:MAG: hypothetical protein HW421_2206 [Ignavibacteria bacterium]|nr:hypothetical protein [Ignavibacteria bacterium]
MKNMLDELKDNFDRLVFKFKLENFRAMNESQTRLSYIDKFWGFLGWDVSNQEQVQVERTDRSSMRPDYRFMKKNKILFFVEAKKPSEELTNLRHIYQTKLYCWNATVPLAILTDFEEFRPFRSIGKPNLNDGKKGIIKEFDMTYEEYPDRAYDLLNTFGREAVLGGSLNALLKPTQIELRDTVDKHFLNTLSKWRTDLATQIAKTNKFTNEFELSEAVQRILDRLVFLRILQDREIETDDYMCRISKNKSVAPYQAFLRICSELAPKYNGLIFNPHPLSENLSLEGSLFKKIVLELDSEDSPYRFDEIPVEMLGTIYERFLGDEINLDKKGKVLIDQKPEVRKAGGVYYTPQYIVEYIVQNTVGKLLYGDQGSEDWERGSSGTGKTNFRTQDPDPRPPCKTPDDVAKLKILDPACGSGSFLLGAFDALIKWHEDYFSANPTKIVETIKKQSYILAYLDEEKKNTKLTARMKGRILQNNLFGVDLDKQATEVAQMSLYIKVLEGMANESQQRFGFQDAILPKLEDNIKCGNSLIGTDFIKDDFFGLSEREKHKINPFDWEKEFPQVFGIQGSGVRGLGPEARKTDSQSPPPEPQNGFDAVIGNPPYGADLSLIERQYFENKFKVGTTDTAALFMKSSYKLMNNNGVNSFIVPKPFVYSSNWNKVRELLINNLIELVDCSKVWKEVKLEQVIFLINNSVSKPEYLSCRRENQSMIKLGKIDKLTFKEFGFILNGISNVELLIGRKIRKSNIFLNDIVNNNRGGMLQSSVIDDNHDYSVLGGKQINRYNTLIISKGFIAKENINDNKAYIKENSILVQNIVAHIQNPKDHIEIIATSFNSKKHIILDTVNQLENKSEYHKYYILGILNSKLMNWYVYRFIYAKAIRTMHFDSPITSRVPYPKLSLLNKSEKSKHDRMVELVERMLKLHKDRASASEFDRKHIEQYIARTDKEIDSLVYELYGLTEEEIRIVEGK